MFCLNRRKFAYWLAIAVAITTASMSGSKSGDGDSVNAAPLSQPVRVVMTLA